MMLGKLQWEIAGYIIIYPFSSFLPGYGEKQVLYGLLQPYDFTFTRVNGNVTRNGITCTDSCGGITIITGRQCKIAAKLLLTGAGNIGVIVGNDGLLPRLKRYQDGWSAGSEKCRVQCIDQ